MFNLKLFSQNSSDSLILKWRSINIKTPQDPKTVFCILTRAIFGAEFRGDFYGYFHIFAYSY